MNKNTYAAVRLAQGEMHIYDFGGVKLHAYQTCDPLEDEVFLVEKEGRFVVIESPCFTGSIAALNGYLEGRDVAGVLLSYHGAGASFLPDSPKYATANAAEYARQGGGKALIDQFAAAFGSAFVYTHMLGHDCHSIVAGAGHADAMIAQLRSCIQTGYDLILTSHYTPEDLKDAEAKISYLEQLKAIAASCADGASFKAAVRERYPAYGGENYLDMTAGFFFG